MFLLSFLLVLVAATTLVVGLFRTDSLLLLWISMTAATVAGLVLLVGLALRGRTAPEGTAGPVTPGDVAQDPTAPDDAATDTSPATPGTAAGGRRVVRRVVRRPAGAAGGVAAAGTTRVVVRPDGTRRVVRTVARGPSAGGATPARPTAAAAAPATPQHGDGDARPRPGSRGATARAALAEVEGVGPAERTALLGAFGSLEAIGTASVDELIEVGGVGPAVARQLRATFGPSGD